MRTWGLPCCLLAWSQRTEIERTKGVLFCCDIPWPFSSTRISEVVAGMEMECVGNAQPLLEGGFLSRAGREQVAPRSGRRAQHACWL
eukprot:scaffold129006_cov18-Tisochrysis_lutea.AAC.1